MSILLLSNKWDISIDFIVNILRKKNVSYIRINTEDLIDEPVTVNIPNFSFMLKTRFKSINLVQDLKSVYLRRPGKPFEFSDNKPKESIINYVTDQWHSLISGIQAIPDILWINNPLKNNFAEIKINQLFLANKIGLKIPETCITSEKKSLELFWSKCNQKIIAKALYSPLIKDKNEEFFIFTNQILKIDDIDEEDLKISPTIFQEALIEKTDYRITVIGDKCFTVKILSNGSIKSLDWRTLKENIKFVRCDLPSDLEEKCIKLVKEFGLVFGAIDIVQSGDEYYFLEINPNGEWGWLQKSAGLPIAESIADKLCEV